VFGSLDDVSLFLECTCRVGSSQILLDDKYKQYMNIYKDTKIKILDVDMKLNLYNIDYMHS
jgi:hypothetical protein